jgi:hypothetical protein
MGFAAVRPVNGLDSIVLASSASKTHEQKGHKSPLFPDLEVPVKFGAGPPGKVCAYIQIEIL